MLNTGMGARFKFPPSAGETEAQRVAVLWPGEGMQSRVCLPTARAFPAPTQRPAPAALKWDGLGAGVGGRWHLPGRECALCCSCYPWHRVGVPGWCWPPWPLCSVKVSVCLGRASLPRALKGFGFNSWSGSMPVGPLVGVSTGGNRSMSPPPPLCALAVTQPRPFLRTCLTPPWAPSCHPAAAPLGVPPSGIASAAVPLSLVSPEPTTPTRFPPAPPPRLPLKVTPDLEAAKSRDQLSPPLRELPAAGGPRRAPLPDTVLLARRTPFGVTHRHSLYRCLQLFSVSSAQASSDLLT